MSPKQWKRTDAAIGAMGTAVAAVVVVVAGVVVVVVVPVVVVLVAVAAVVVGALGAECAVAPGAPVSVWAAGQEAQGGGGRLLVANACREPWA